MPTVESVFKGLRPAVVGLLASAALVLMNTENFGSPSTDMYSFVVSVILFLIAFIGTRKLSHQSYSHHRRLWYSRSIALLTKVTLYKKELKNEWLLPVFKLLLFNGYCYKVYNFIFLLNRF